MLNMSSNNIAKQLHVYERKVLLALFELDKQTNLNVLVQKTQLKDLEVMRALQWLSNKELVTYSRKEDKFIELTKSSELPELKFLNNLIDVAKNPLTFVDKDSVVKDLDDKEVNISIGSLKKKNAIAISKKDGRLNVAFMDDAPSVLESLKKEQEFLQKLPMESKHIEHFSVMIKTFMMRGLIKENKKVEILVTMSDKGKSLVSSNKDEISNFDLIERIDNDVIQKQLWKKKDIRAYDVTINVPSISGGRKHFVNQAIEYIKRIWLDLGFKEMQGSFVSTAFWDLDALFVPQDHPAREMQDTFYLDEPNQGNLPDFKKTVKDVHENGADTGSKGWQYNFSYDEAKRLMLRTHTTVLSAHTISTLSKEDLPAKFFAVGKVFRNEALDWSHLFEFYQVEGIVVDPNANLKHLKGYLKEFYKKMGYTDVRMRPAHFPYTEPSVEVEVYHPGKKQWIELGGAGIFRPEVTKTLLGFECPVLAWGQGMGRIISEYFKITDIRDLYKNDLKQLKEIKEWMK